MQKWFHENRFLLEDNSHGILHKDANAERSVEGSVRESERATVNSQTSICTAPLRVGRFFVNPSRNSTEPLPATLFLLAMNVPVLLFLGVFSSSLPELLAEDGLIENLSVIALSTGVLFGLYASFESSRGSRLPALIVAAFAFFCLMEEISYGERILGWSMPVVRDIKLDAAHDLVPLVHHTLRDIGVSNVQIALFGTGLVVSLFWLFRVPCWHLLKRSETLVRRPEVRLLPLAVVCGLIGCVADLKTGSMMFLCVEELFELNLAFLVLLSACRVVRKPIVGSDTVVGHVVNPKVIAS